MFKLKVTSGMSLVTLGGIRTCVYVSKGRLEIVDDAAASSRSGRIADVRVG